MTECTHSETVAKTSPYSSELLLAIASYPSHRKVANQVCINHFHAAVQNNWQKHLVGRIYFCHGFRGSPSVMVWKVRR